MQNTDFVFTTYTAFFKFHFYILTLLVKYHLNISLHYWLNIT